MKKAILFILMLASMASHAQLLPLRHTDENRVLTDRATQAKFALIIPGGATPGFPAYVPDSLKAKSIYMKTSGSDQGLYRWDGSAFVYAVPMPDLSGYALNNAVFKLGGGNTGSGSQALTSGNFTTNDGYFQSQFSGRQGYLKGSVVGVIGGGFADFSDAGAGGIRIGHVLKPVRIESAATGSVLGDSKTIEFAGNTITRLSDGKKVLFEGDAVSDGIKNITEFAIAQSADFNITGSGKLNHLQASSYVSVANGSGSSSSLTSNTVSLQKSSGVFELAIDDSGNGSLSSNRLLTITGSDDINIVAGSGKVVNINGSPAITSGSSTLTTLQSNVASNTSAISTEFSRATLAEASKLSMTGGSMTGTINSQSLIPTANNTYNLGSTTNEFNIVYANQVVSAPGNAFNLGTSGGNTFNFLANSTAVGRISTSGQFTWGGSLTNGGFNVDLLSTVRVNTLNITTTQSNLSGKGLFINANTLQVEKGNVVVNLTLAQVRALNGGVNNPVLVFINDSGMQGQFVYDGSDATSTDNTGTIVVSTDGYRYKRTFDKSHYRASWFGISSSSTTDHTSSITSMLSVIGAAGGGIAIFDVGVYNLRDVTVPANIIIEGSGIKTIFRFKGSGTPASDAASYVWRFPNTGTELKNCTVDGYLSSPSGSTIATVGNGLYISPDGNGNYSKAIRDVVIQGFCGYKASVAGGTYGVNSNFGRTDISDGAGGHLLTGGNGIVCDPLSGGSDLHLFNITVLSLDGVGIDLGNVNDSKLMNIYIGQCMAGGLWLRLSNKNVQGTNVKVFRCRSLNVNEPFVTSIGKQIPHELTNSVDVGSIILSGSNLQFANLEAQENASIGIQLGTPLCSLSSSSLNVDVDGNGGYDTGATTLVNQGYQRVGIEAVNYYLVKITGAADDFRTKFNYGRQLKAIESIATKPTINAIASVYLANWYYIKTAGTGADYAPVQAALTTKSNLVGTVFQWQSNGFPSTYGSATFGTGGVLEAVNDYLDVQMVVSNQIEQNSGTGSGYSVVNDRGHSKYIINNVTTP